MRKALIKCIDRAVKNTLNLNVNSTTSFTAFQPSVPKELKNMSKFNRSND